MNHIIYRKLFLSPYYFTIAIGKKAHSVIDHTTFEAEYVMPARPEKWVADPMLVDSGSETFLFYEAVYNDKGRIEVARVNDDCSLGEPVVLLEDDCHYSYPFVFRYNETWYMIPESSASNEVRLYEATDFPWRWQKKTVLLREKSVDTTVMDVEGKKILLTYLIHQGTERVTPRAYRMELSAEDVRLMPMSWDEFDELTSRGAGPAFREGNQVYRPAQISDDQKYGNAVAFYQVQPEGEHYREKEVCRLTPEHVQAAHCWYDGLHTYSESSRFSVIDLRCRRFDFWKVPKALCAKCKR